MKLKIISWQIRRQAIAAEDHIKDTVDKPLQSLGHLEKTGFLCTRSDDQSGLLEYIPWKTTIIIVLEFGYSLEKGKKINTRRGSPIDSRPSPAETPPIGKIHAFSKIAVTLEPLVRFGCPLRFIIS